MEEDYKAVKSEKPRVRRKAIMHVPGDYIYDPNTEELTISNVSIRASAVIDRMADLRGVSNGVIFCELIDYFAEYERIRKRFAEFELFRKELREALNWVDRQQQETATAPRPASSPRRTRHSRKAEPKPEPQPSEGIPFMITRAMKARLEALGYTQEEVRQMTPAQAHVLLAARTKPSR